jgi:hypothetical protein
MGSFGKVMASPKAMGYGWISLVHIVGIMKGIIIQKSDEHIL